MTLTPPSDAPEYQRLVLGILSTRRWSRARLAAEMGLSPSTINNWAAGTSQPRQWEMPILRALLRGVDTSALGDVLDQACG